MLELYQNIRKYRKELKMSQEELAQRVGYNDRSSIAKIEKGLVDLPQSKIALFAKVFGVSSGALMGNDGIEVDPFEDPNISDVDTRTYPLFDGIAAGQPRLMSDIKMYVDADANIKADFILKVHGDSMIGARITDGDYVFIHEQPTVENGEIAAVAIDNEDATLKRFYRYGDMIALRSENPLYKEITFSGREQSRVRIIGKAVAFQSFIEGR